MPKQRIKGFTLIEILISISIVFTLLSITIITINPREYQKKARDSKRLTDITNLAIAIESYKLKTGVYPDASDTERISTTPVAPSTNIMANSGGWIGADMSEYIDKLYADPINNSIYNYRYKHTENDYELDVKLEYYLEKSQEDSGNNVSRYEVGTDLDILN